MLTLLGLGDPVGGSVAVGCGSGGPLLLNERNEMSSVNKVILIGNLGQDPELRYTKAGGAVCNLSVATNEKWKNKQGEQQERTEWHRVVVWNLTAENCAKYLSKGKSVYIEGSLQTKDWEDKEGNKRYTTEIQAQRVQFLGGKHDEDSSGSRDDVKRGTGQSKTGSGAPPADFGVGKEIPKEPEQDDIPF